MFGKYLAYLVATVLVVLPSVMVLYFLVVPTGGGSLAGSFIPLLKDLAILGIGLAAYGALFAWVGAQFKHPLVTGLVFAFGWEQGIMLIPGYFKRLTIAYYLQGLVPHAMPQDSALSFIQAVVSTSLSVPWSLFWLSSSGPAFWRWPPAPWPAASTFSNNESGTISGIVPQRLQFCHYRQGYRRVKRLSLASND